MNQQLPLEIRRLASSLFAGNNSGFSGPEIFEWFGQFSTEIGDYPWSNAGSRWMMFESCLESFPIPQQYDLLQRLIEYRGPMKHSRPSQEELGQLKKLVLEYASTFRGSESILTKVNWDSVREAWTKTIERTPSDPEGAITAARTALESVCKHILERQGVEDKSKGDLIKLYKATAQELQLSPGGYAENVFKQILGGCASVAAGLAGLRNAYGDSHGKGTVYTKPQPRHARLAVNATMTFAEFLIETFEARKAT